MDGQYGSCDQLCERIPPANVDIFVCEYILDLFPVLPVCFPRQQYDRAKDAISQGRCDLVGLPNFYGASERMGVQPFLCKLIRDRKRDTKFHPAAYIRCGKAGRNQEGSDTVDDQQQRYRMLWLGCSRGDFHGRWALAGGREKRGRRCPGKSVMDRRIPFQQRIYTKYGWNGKRQEQTYHADFPQNQKYFFWQTVDRYSAYQCDCQDQYRTGKA